MADALVVDGLAKRFGGLHAVQGVSFTVREGETLALIGPNGAGKTTAFNLITGFYRPDAGSVRAFGSEMVGLRPYHVCSRGLARTFQVAKPFGAMTVLENVMTFAFLRDHAPPAARDQARAELAFLGLCARARADDDRPAAPRDGARARHAATAAAPRRSHGGIEPGGSRPGGVARAQARRARAHHRRGRAPHARGDGGREAGHRPRPRTENR